MTGEHSMMTVAELRSEMARGGYFVLAGDEKLLAQLPPGNWVGGTIPYFMAEAGGLLSQEKIYVLKLPEYISKAEIRTYPERALPEIYKDAPENGFSYMVMPASSKTHFSFALNAPGYSDFAASPLAGWIAGVALPNATGAVPKVFNGLSPEALEDAAVVLHASLPKGKTAVVGIINIFEPSNGDRLAFLSDGFSAAEVLVNGEKRNFARYIAEKKLDIKLPLVANCGGALVNVSFQEVDASGGEVRFFAPVFKDVEYRHAKPVGDYLRSFLDQKPGGIEDRVLFSCNCVLNYLYAGLEGRRTPGFTGPVTFGEIAYQLLNQTAVYIEIVTANLAERLRDDTAMRRLNSEIRRQRDEILVLQNGLEQTTLGVVLTDTSGVIKYVNPAYTGLYGYEAAEVIGKTPRILKSGETPLPLYESLWKTLLSGRAWSGELRNRAKAGELVWVRVNISPIRDSDGKLTHFMAFHKDITLEKQLVAEVVDSKRQADKANQAKSDFLASMSHEIRTPLNAIVGMSELIDEAGLNKEQAQYLAVMRNASDTLLSLINDILDISKIEAGKIDIEKAPFNLEELVSKVSEMMAVRAFKKNVEISFKIEADVPVFVEGDATRLRQVLMNLMGNAVKFVEKGWISLSVSRQKTGADGLQLLFSVRDTGIGIPPEKMGSVFEKFTQADSSTTRKYGGTGLGLPISKMLIELMGGRIWLESEPGVGTTFFFTVNLSAQKENLAVYLPKADMTELKGRRFLVVDDNLTNRIIIREMIQSWGASCEGASDGEKGLAKVLEQQRESTPFHGVFVDFNMPGMDGYEFCRRVVTDAAIAPKPALALVTSDTVRFRKEDFRSLGVNTHLMKPVKKQTVLDGALELLAARVSAPVPASQTAPVYKKEDLPALSILLVDDSEDNRLLINSFLKGTKIRLESAVDGFDGLEKFKSGSYDLVFMDMQMPGMDGFEATRKLRELEAAGGRRRTRVVALTAMAMREDIDRALKSGCDDYLTKPIRKGAIYAYLMGAAAG
ncbi:MAG: response regulator [Elusimicrobia bacterium]|nr:response regulator [Elusimicrobiota bacterium]